MTPTDAPAPRPQLVFLDEVGAQYPCTIIDKRPTAGYVFIQYTDARGDVATKAVESTRVIDPADHQAREELSNR